MRKMREEDRALYLEMAREFYESEAVLAAVPTEHFARTFAEMRRADDYVEGYLLECEGEAAGYALIAKTFTQEAGGMVAWLEEIYVRPAYQGRGLGTDFLRAYERLAQGRFARLRLEVEPENERAAALYRRMGYQTLGYEQWYKTL